MRNAINWFELPTRDLERAARFYEAVLGHALKRTDFMGVPHAIFDSEEQGVGGALILDPQREPLRGGALIYLDARGDLRGCLTRVEQAGGAVTLPWTSIGPMGAIAVLVDTEGNQVGLHQP